MNEIAAPRFIWLRVLFWLWLWLKSLSNFHCEFQVILSFNYIIKHHFVWLAFIRFTIFIPCFFPNFFFFIIFFLHPVILCNLLVVAVFVILSSSSSSSSQLSCVLLNQHELMNWWTDEDDSGVFVTVNNALNWDLITFSLIWFISELQCINWIMYWTIHWLPWWLSIRTLYSVFNSIQFCIWYIS